MKLIIKIARNELRNLFYSPVAWFLAITFLVMCAFYYTGMMYGLSKSFHLLYVNNSNMAIKGVTSMTEDYIMSGFYTRILPQIYLFVPLLTMSIISQELNAGTIKLLYSSPVKIYKIVLGKYLALMAFSLVLILIFAVFILSAFFDIKSLDIGLVLSGMLGFYLLTSALTAIGFFMSSLTTYPVVAAVASFAVLFILSGIGNLWQDYDFVRDLSYFLSISGRTERMISGLITTKDLIYYLVIIYMFVGFVILKLKDGHDSRPWYLKTSRYLVVIISGLLIGYISSRPRFTGYFDANARKINTIHPKTQEILKELGDSVLEVTLYTNILGENFTFGLPAGRNNYIDLMWEQYLRFKPDIKLKYEYYYDYNPYSDDSSLYKTFPGKNLKQLAGLIARAHHIDSSLFKSPEEMHKQIDLKPEGYRLIMQFKYKGRKELLRLTKSNGWGNAWSSEQNVNAVLKRLLGKKIPKIYFMTGELERNIYKTGQREYYKHTIAKELRGSLINVGFDVDTINLSTQDIPADATTIVLADPKMVLSATVLNKLRNYIDNAGNMLIMGEPGKQYVLNPLLRQIGIQFMDGQLVQPSFNETPDKISLWYSPANFHLAEEFEMLYFKHLLENNAYQNGFGMMVAGAMGLSYIKDSGFNANPLWVTIPDKTWDKMGKLVTDSVAPVFSPLDGDIQENSFLVALQLTRQKNNKEQRIIVVGDADFSGNMRITEENTRALYSWLNYNEFPIYTPIPYAKDNMILLNPRWAAWQKIIYLWVMPGLLLIIGAILLIRRNRK